MIVSCPSCETKFEIPDDKYRPGRKARCSNCGNVFALPDMDGPASPVADVSVAREFSMPEDAPSIPEQSATEVPADGDAVPPDFASIDSDAGAGYGSDAGESPAVPAPPASLDDVVAPVPPAKADEKRSGKRLLFVLGTILVVAILAYGAVMVYTAFFTGPTGADPERISDKNVVDSLGGRTAVADPEKEAARLAAVRGLALENVRQYTVTENENTGPMVVVEGAVVNNFDAPKDLVLLEVTLFDNKGNALVLREQYCGVVLSLLQLRTLSKPAIESALTSQYMILTNNTDIPPGGRVPFTTVFFDLPNSAYEFEVKIVDAQDPAKTQK